MACQLGPVAISTASMSPRASNSRRSRYVAQSWLPYLVSALLLDGFPPRGLDIANGHEVHVGLLQETAQIVGAPAADADAAQHDAVAGGDAAVPAHHGAADHLRRHQQGAHLGGGLQEPPAVEAGLWITRGEVGGGGAFGGGGRDSFHCYSISVPGTSSSLGLLWLKLWTPVHWQLHLTRISVLTGRRAVPLSSF